MSKEEKVNLDDLEFLQLGETPSDPKPDDGEVETPAPSDEKPEEGQDDETPEEKEVKDLDDDVQDDVTEDPEKDEVEAKDEKDTSEEEGEETEQTSFFNKTVDELGIELTEEDRAGINFDDPTEEDLTKFNQVVGKKMAEKEFESLLEQYPETKQFLEYEKSGVGDPRQFIETYYPQIDYSEIEFDEENEQLHEQLVINQLSAEGYEQEEITEMVEDFRTGGILDKQAKRSLKKLEHLQKQQKEQLKKQQEDAVKEAQRRVKEQRQNAEEIVVDNKNLKGIDIPEEEGQALINYLFEPVNEQGASQAQIDSQNMEFEERLLIGYLKMKGFDLASLIDNEAETKQTKKIKEQIRKSKSSDKPKGGERQTKSSGTVNDIKPIF